MSNPHGYSTGPATPEQVPEGTAIALSLSNHIADVSMAAIRLQAFADRLLGGAPTGVDSAKGGVGSTVQPPLASRLRALDDVLTEHLQRLHDQINRLEHFA